MIPLQADGNLFALFHCTGNECDAVELSDDLKFIRSEISVQLPHAFLIPSPSDGAQLWRCCTSAARLAEKQFAGLNQNAYEFAATSNVPLSSISLRTNDMIYVNALCTIAEVKGTTEPDGTLSVVLASELHHDVRRNSTRAFYQFEYHGKVISVARDEIQFPIDLAFDPTNGIFELRKSRNMSSV